MKTFTIEYDETEKVMKMTDPNGITLTGLKSINFGIFADYYGNGCGCDCDNPQDNQKVTEETLQVTSNFNQKY